MALAYNIEVRCKNKLCDYSGSYTLYDTPGLTEPVVCPKCGFKTLVESSLFNVYNLREQLGSVTDLFNDIVDEL